MRPAMQYPPIVRTILTDESLTRHLGDIEARILIEWLIGWAEVLLGTAAHPDQAVRCIQAMCRRARAISRFVGLWTEPQTRGAAIQLAGTERFTWSLPLPTEEPAELMERVLAWESEHLAD